jgi:hypothetical protein
MLALYGSLGGRPRPRNASSKTKPGSPERGLLFMERRASPPVHPRVEQVGTGLPLRHHHFGCHDGAAMKRMADTSLLAIAKQPSLYSKTRAHSPKSLPSYTIGRR